MTMIRTVIDQVSRMDAEELNRVVEAVKMRRTYIAKTTARSLSIGDSVSFESKRGVTVQGTVTKVNSKTVVVDTVHDGRWKVTASMLTLLAA
jgi:FKBP-type peptidyl-prolyl cis-trans isomerase 2